VKLVYGPMLGALIGVACLWLPPLGGIHSEASAHGTHEHFAAGEPGVAFMAHIAGFIAGAVMVFFFRQRQVEVFQPSHSRPFAMETRRVGFRRPTRW